MNEKQSMAEGARPLLHGEYGPLDRITALHYEWSRYHATDAYFLVPKKIGLQHYTVYMTALVTKPKNVY